MGRMIRGTGPPLGMTSPARVHGACRKWPTGTGPVSLVGSARSWRKEIW